MPRISPLSLVDPSAQLADDVEVGPFCTIGARVALGPGCRLISHVVIAGHTSAGANNLFYPNAVIGTEPQDLKYRGGATRLEIGDGNTFREHVTVHVGTEKGGWVTRVGSGNLLMVNAHVGHDVQVGDRCIIANNVMIAGHVNVSDNVAIMGGVGIHHFVTVGEFAYLAGYARINHDVPPFVKVGDEDRIRAVNALGLRRAGFSEADIDALEDAARRLFIGREKPFSTALAEFDTMNGINPHVKKLIEFLRRRDTGKNGRYLEAFRAK